MMKFCQKICNKIKGLFYKNSEPSEVMDNVVNSMFLCQPLYDKLKKKCHPDKFETTDKRDLAEELFQQLQENRYNLKGLQELEERINSL